MSEKKMLQGIASILEETLPEDWSKVVFYAEYAEGAFSIEYYVAGSGKDDFVKSVSYTHLTLPTTQTV